MNLDQARSLFSVVNENEKVNFSRIPRCVIRDRSISVHTKDVYYYLISRCCNPGDPFTWITQGTMAMDLIISVQKIRAHLKSLKDRGLISISKEKKTSRNVYMICDVANVYGDKVNEPWPKWSDYQIGDEKAENGKVPSPLPRELKGSQGIERKGSHPGNEKVLQSRIRELKESELLSPYIPLSEFEDEGEELQEEREEEEEDVLKTFEQEFGRKVSDSERKSFEKNLASNKTSPQELQNRFKELAADVLLKLSTKSPNRVFFIDDARKWRASAREQMINLAKSSKCQILGQFSLGAWGRLVLECKFTERLNSASQKDLRNLCALAFFNASWNELNGIENENNVVKETYTEQEDDQYEDDLLEMTSSVKYAKDGDIVSGFDFYGEVTRLVSEELEIRSAS